jgi:hypothetical protein
MAYDAATQTVMLFGGTASGGEMNDTWIWDGANWTPGVTAESPVPRSGHSMAYDAARGEIVLFGGFHYADSPTWYSDTWVWDASGWHQHFSDTPPVARAGHLLAYHPALRCVVLVGGAGGKTITSTGYNYDFRRELWTWNGISWTQQFPADQPGAAYTMGAAYDDTRQELMLHVGDDLTCASRGPKTLLLQGSNATSIPVRRPSPPPRAASQ